MKDATTKENLHPRNLHNKGYDFNLLLQAVPALKPLLVKNKSGKDTILFSNPEAVLLLNTALLKHHYKIEHWEIPKGFLCPPIPGRSDYLHYLADILSDGIDKNIPKGNKVQVLDIGTGANLIYPLLGNKLYGWSFLGTDSEKIAIANAKKTIQKNKLSKEIQLKHQQKIGRIFHGIIEPTDYFDVAMCNPPFHDSELSASAGTQRKWKHLGKKDKTVKNFGGKNNELIYPGGEILFIQKMLDESTTFSKQVLWFSTLVSKADNLPKLNRKLDKIKVSDRKEISMSQGNKQSRILAWSFFDKKQQAAWKKLRF